MPTTAAMSDSAIRCITTEPARALVEYYLAARGTAQVLTREAFDPSGLRKLLPRIFMLELHAEDDIRIRLCGTCLVDKVGRELTGKNWLDLIAPEHRAERARRYRMLARGDIGLRAVVRYPSTFGDEMEIEIVTLPLSPANAAGPALAVGIVASITRTAGAKPMPFGHGSEKVSELPLAA